MSSICRLERVAGRCTPCPEDACPFWEPGGAVLEGRCAFERLDLTGRPEVVAELLHVRHVLESTFRVERGRLRRKTPRKVSPDFTSPS